MAKKTSGIFVFTLSFWIVLLCCSIGLSEGIDIEKILRLSESRYDGLNNVKESFFHVSETDNDPATRTWRKSTMYTERSGKYRWDWTVGHFGKDGSKITDYKTRVIYDGKIYIDYDFNYSARLGQRKGTDTYALIRNRSGNHMPWPTANWLGRGAPANGIRHFQKNKYNIVIRKDKANENIIILDVPKYYEDGKVKAQLDLNIGCLEKTREYYTSNGTLIRSTVRTFKKIPIGLWVVDEEKNIFKERSLTYGPSKEVRHFPSSKFTTQLVELIINDPHFDKEIFTIKLKAGTKVADSRYQVDYHVRDFEITGEEIDKAAEQALIRQTKNRLNLEFQN